MFVSFKVLEGHPLAKDLLGGRCRIKPGEDLFDALRRRIGHDTHAEVLSVTKEAEASDPDRYRLTLRGAVGWKRRAEGSIVVALRTVPPGIG